MPMRRTVGISLVCFVTSACVAAETPEISASHYPGDPAGSTPCGDARGRIIDLSPRAADALDMKRAGVVPVVIEPLLNLAAPVVAMFQTSGAAVAQ